MDANYEEIFEFESICWVCGSSGTYKLLRTCLPSIKEVLIMSYCCGECGFRDTEVKSLSEISEKGKEYELSVICEEDLKRGIFKSDTASLKIPELKLELTNGILGGVQTTVQGLLHQILIYLKSHNPFTNYDEQSNKMEEVFNKLEQFINGKQQFTLIIRDLVNSSFICGLGEQDMNLQIKEFIRNDEDNEYLGIQN